MSTILPLNTLNMHSLWIHFLHLAHDWIFYQNPSDNHRGTWTAQVSISTVIRHHPPVIPIATSSFLFCSFSSIFHLLVLMHLHTTAAKAISRSSFTCMILTLHCLRSIIHESTSAPHVVAYHQLDQLHNPLSIYLSPYTSPTPAVQRMLRPSMNSTLN